MRTNIWIHFVHCHMRYTVVILDGGNHTHTCFPEFEMFIPWAELNGHHPMTALCAHGVYGNRRRLDKEEDQAGKVTAFRAYDRPLETVFSFKYLGCLMAATNDNWMAVITHIWKARKS